MCSILGMILILVGNWYYYWLVYNTEIKQWLTESSQPHHHTNLLICGKSTGLLMKCLMTAAGLGSKSAAGVAAKATP